MLDGLQQVRGGDTVLPFVLQFHSDPSQHLWTDDCGDTHVIHQVMFHLLAWRCMQPRIAPTHSHRPEFGEVLDFRHSKGFVCWASRCHEEYVQAELRATTEKHSILLDRIPLVQDLQSAWLLLLFCANTRATCSLRGIPPAETEQFALAHDVATWRCFTRLWGISGVGDTQDWASLPFQMGGCGLRSATRIRVSAHWAS